MLALWWQRPGRLPLLAHRGVPSAHPELSSSTAGRPRARQGGMDVTFLLTSDTHVGYPGIEGIDLVVPEAHAIKGIVVDESGDPIEGVRVSAVIASRRGRRSNVYAVSRSDGSFEHASLEEGEVVGQQVFQRGLSLQEGTFGVCRVDHHIFPGSSDPLQNTFGLYLEEGRRCFFQNGRPAFWTGLARGCEPGEE